MAGWRCQITTTSEFIALVLRDKAIDDEDHQKRYEGW